MDGTRTGSMVAMSVAAALFACKGGASDPVDGGPPDGGAARAVSGTAVDRHVVGAGEVSVPQDLSGVTVAAHVLDGDGNYSTIAGTGNSNGTFSIDEVPGRCVLQVGAVYVETSSDSVDVGGYFLGRPDAVLSADAYDLDFDVSGLNPWQSTDELQMFSADAGAAYFALFLSSIPPTAVPVGSTSFNRTASFTPGFVPFIDGSVGDVATVTQLVSDNAVGESYKVVRKAVDVPSFTQVEGVSTSITAAMADVAQTESVTLDWRRFSFEEHRAAVHPDSSKTSGFLSIGPMPRADELGFYGPFPDLLIFQGTETNDVNLGTLSYGSPFPGDWIMFGSAQSCYTKGYRIPGSSQTGVGGCIGVDDVAGAFSGGPVEPRMTPVQSLQVNGMNATTELTGVGLTPEISWSDPEVGDPDVINVTFCRIFTDGTTSMRDCATSVFTDDNSIVVPPGVMQQGEAYAIIVTAQSGRGTIDRPLQWSLPSAYAPAVTSLIRP